MRYRFAAGVFAVIAMFASPTFAVVTLVEPGHTLTKVADSCAPSHPSQSMLDSACTFGNAGTIESIAVDPASGLLYVQLSDFGADSCIFSVDPTTGVVTLINSSTGFFINERGTDLHVDPATGLLLAQNDNGAPSSIATVAPVFPGATGVYAPMPGTIFAGGTFGMDFSAGAGGSVVPAGDVVFVSDVSASGIHATGSGGPVSAFLVTPPVPGDDFVIQPDGDWIHVPDTGGIITAYDPFPPFTATPSPTPLITDQLFTNAGLQWIFGSRATVCDTNGELYVSYSGASGGSGIFRVDEPLVTSTLLLTIGPNEGLHDLAVGPASAGGGGFSVFFTAHDQATQCEEVWEVTIGECDPTSVPAITASGAFVATFAFVFVLTLMLGLTGAFVSRRQTVA